MLVKCKLCGKEAEVNSAYYTGNHNKRTIENYICDNCKKYCYRECEYQKKHIASWHEGKCVNCEHNPYMQLHRWDGDKWIRK